MILALFESIVLFWK